MFTLEFIQVKSLTIVHSVGSVFPIQVL
uniref:Uncharacterized protein n=1 Tax=Anguilla anguilla TaxID=7936 RepID=A0A0E9VZE2_ANGAN